MILYGFTMNMINTTCDATHYPDEKIRFKMRWLGFHAPKKKSDRYAKHTHTHKTRLATLHNSAMLGPSHPDTNARCMVRR